ncbi:MAG: hypothetical protein OXT64_07770 [Gammaproteobacteria bacterium]|nr:hypothetical protein [Gammaproteobacteria bacterium]
MASEQFHSSTSNDAAILEAFEKIATELSQDIGKCSVTIHVMSQFSAQFILSDRPNQAFVQHANEVGGASWTRVEIAFNPLPLTVDLSRDREANDDVISVSYDASDPDLVDVTRSVVAVQRQFVPLNRAAAIERALGPEIAEFYRRREEGLARLEALTQRIVEETHNYRMQLDSETANHKRVLGEAFEEKAKALDDQHQRRSAAVDAQAQELDKRRRDLDDRSARHARRQQSRELQDKISGRTKKFELTAETQHKRRSVHAIFILLLVVSGSVIVHSLAFPAATTEGVALWLELGRVPLGVLGFALTSVFYIRWNDQWFRQHANQEFRFQQLALDVDRAGYAVEMLMEWQEEKGSEMPAVMVDRLTTGLFTDQTTEARVRHPTEDVTSALLKASSAVRVDVPGVGEATVTGRRVRKLERDLKKEQDA